jgi:hypothetical protein
MRNVAVAVTLALILLAGCAEPKPANFSQVPGPSHHSATLPPAAAPAPTETRVRPPAPAIVAPDALLNGKVARFNEAGRFVVLEFPISHLPVIGQILFVYRNGLKVGEIKVTGPQRDDHTVADLTTGEAQTGDEVRDQ